MKHVTRLAMVILTFSVLIVLSPGAAHAIIPDNAPPPGTPCDPNDWPGLERTHTWVDSAETDLVLTQFLAVNIAPGTTGTRTDVLTRVNEVTVMFGISTEISAATGVIFAKVSTKVGFEVQVTSASTDTSSNTMTWTFNQPGYYGLYKGTRRVVGTATTESCLPPPITPSWQWVMKHGGALPYTTYANMEEGTISCDVPAPPGSLRELAKRQIGC